MAIVMGFDPSIVVTGYSALDRGSLLECGDIKIPPGELSERLAYLMAEVERLVMTFRPTIAAVEKPPAFSFARSTDKWTGKGLNAKDILKCGFAMAAIVGMLGRHKVYVDEFDAHRWKICAGRNLGKEEMVRLARSLHPKLQRAKLSDHAAEAVCMATLTRGPNNLEQRRCQ